MTSKAKRRGKSSPEAVQPTAQPTSHANAESDAGLTCPRPSPPQPNKRLLQISAIALLCWFGFLAWMAFFS